MAAFNNLGAHFTFHHKLYIYKLMSHTEEAGRSGKKAAGLVQQAYMTG